MSGDCPVCGRRIALASGKRTILNHKNTSGEKCKGVGLNPSSTVRPPAKSIRPRKIRRSEITNGNEVWLRIKGTDQYLKCFIRKGMWLYVQHRCKETGEIAFYLSRAGKHTRELIRSGKCAASWDEVVKNWNIRYWDLITELTEEGFCVAA